MGRTTDLLTEKDAASTASLRYQDALDDDDHPTALRYLRQIRRHVQRMEEAHVAAMRWQGESWEAVAAALGVTRQSAWEQYRYLDT